MQTNKENKLIFPILYVFGFIKASIISIIVTSYVPIQIEYGLTLLELGNIASSYYFLAFLGSIIWTYFLGVISLKKIFTIGSSLWILGLCILAMNLSYLHIIICASIIGFGAVSSTLCILGFVVSVSEGTQRMKKISIFYILEGAGGVFGTLFTGIAEGIYSVRWNYIAFFFGIVAFLIFLYIIILLKNRNIQIKKQEKIVTLNNAMFNPLSEKISKDLIIETLKRRINIFIFIGFSILTFFNVTNNVWLQKYFIDIHDLSQSMATISYMFTSAGEFMGLIICRILYIQFTKKGKYNIPIIGIISGFLSTPLFLIGFLLNWSMTATGTEGMNLIELIWYMVIKALNDIPTFASYSFLFIGFILISIMSNLYVNACVDCNSERTKAFSLNIIIIIINASFFISPALGGLIGTLYSLRTTLLQGPFIYFISGVMFIFIYKYSKKDVIFIPKK